MSEGCINDIIISVGYKTSTTTESNKPFLIPQKEQSLKNKNIGFENCFVKDIGLNIQSGIYFSCFTTNNCRVIDSVINVGFQSSVSQDSDSTAKKALEWLDNVNDYLKGLQYKGKLNYDLHNNVHYYRYEDTTYFNEEFRRLLVNFKEAYLYNYDSHIVLRKT